MESDEDGMVLVIIGDINENATSEEEVLTTTTIKQEQEFDDEAEESLYVEQLLQTAKKHGQHIDFTNVVKNERDSDEDFEMSDYSESGDELLKNPKKNPKRRGKMLLSSEQTSFVAQLRSEKPEFDTEGLIRHLTNIMKSTKPSPPPPDFYRVHDLMFECTNCDTLTNSLPAATRHYQEKHGPRYLVCFACGVDFRSGTNLYKHEKRCNAPDAKLVLQARARMVGRKGRHRPFLVKEPYPREKKKTIPKVRNFNCLECTAVFRNKIALIAHMHLHRGERPYTCHECAASYTAKSALYRHSLKHKNLCYICDQCGRDFKAKSAIIYHMDTHLPQRKHACPYKDCGRRFAQKYALTIHIKGKHQNLPPSCACQICPRRFNRNSLLKLHMKEEHGMILMTRNMFLKSLPTLSDPQVQQAKLIFNDDSTLYHTEKIDSLSKHKETEVKRYQNVEPESVLSNSAESEKDIHNSVQMLLKDKASKLGQNANFSVVKKKNENKIAISNNLKKEYEKLVDDATKEVTCTASMPEL